MMDPVLLHLRVNHLPIAFGGVGALFLIAGLISKRTTLLRYGQISMILAGLAAPVAFLSGREAEEHTERVWYMDKDVVHEHEEAGEWAAIMLGIAGILAVVSLKTDKKVVRGLLVVFALLAAAAATKAGLAGGKIVHENAKLETSPQAERVLPQSAQ